MKTKKQRTNKNRTNKNRTNKNRTNKNRTNKPLLRKLEINFPLYASKKFDGEKLLEYKKAAELKTNDHCLLENSSWFGDLDVAKSYKKDNTRIYKWKIKIATYLFKINKENEEFIDNIFKNTKLNLTTSINIDKDKNKVKYQHEYLNMSVNERALYEFKFAFGYLTLKEQYEFLELIKYLIIKKYIKINKRDGKSILKKIEFKINYYKVSYLFTQKEKYNRISIYNFDKYSVMNFCKLVNNNKYKISGIYQKNDTSFWFPDLIVYKMNIQEYIFFNPHRNLEYDKVIE